MTYSAAIYIRKSREEKDKPSHRLTVQREQLPAYAKAQGWTYEVYDDGHASAARGKAENLKERSRLEADIRARKIDVILTIELSRLSRDDSMQDYVAWLHLCGAHGVKLATLSRMLDPAQNSDWMLLLMEGGFSSVEMRQLQARMAEGRTQAAQDGKFLGGRLPAPYVHGKAKSAPVIDPSLLDRMRTLWSMAETMSTRQIADALSLPLIAVRRAIADDRLLFYQGKRIGPKGEVVDCEWEPCMDAAQAGRIRQNRKNLRSKNPRRQAGGLLTNLGIMSCGYCGRSLRSWQGRKRKNGSQVDFYGCKANEHARLCPPSRLIQQPLFDERVLTNIFGTLSDKEGMHRYWQKAMQGASNAGELSVIEKEEAAANARKQRLIAAIVEGVIDFADGKRQREVLDAELARLQTRRQEALSGQIEEPDWECLAQTREDFDRFTLEEQREFLTLVIEGIKVYATYLVLEYRFPRNETGDRTARVHIPPPKSPTNKGLHGKNT